MVTKLKSRDNLKYLILVILICICSTVLLSRYGSFYEAGEKAQKEKADSMENVISDMGDGLAIGNCILDNEISGGREQSELLEEYGIVHTLSSESDSLLLQEVANPLAAEKLLESELLSADNRRRTD